MTKSLNNLVLCMISEYHLTCLSQGPSYISPVLPEAAKNLLLSMKEYMAGGDFKGTQDTRVVERAKTLQVAVWLHHLDMATAGDRTASYPWTPLGMAGDIWWGSSCPHRQVTSCLRMLLIGSWLRTDASWRTHWTMFRSSGLSSEGSWRTSLRLTKMSLTHLPKGG